MRIGKNVWHAAVSWSRREPPSMEEADCSRCCAAITRGGGAACCCQRLEGGGHLRVRCRPEEGGGRAPQPGRRRRPSVEGHHRRLEDPCQSGKGGSLWKAQRQEYYNSKKLWDGWQELQDFLSTEPDKAQE
ncbi:hypothetical protein E2562_026768, partial [Oryza meyeriana var. granulata]